MVAILRGFGMSLDRLLLAVSLALSAATPQSSAQHIKKPFDMVPLWSDEMLDVLTGETQAACSGDNAGNCKREQAGFCDGTADVTFHRDTTPPNAVFHYPDKQTGSPKPLYFKLRLDAEQGADGTYRYPAGIPGSLRLVFDCQFSGNDACPGHLQVGRVDRVELSTADGTKQADLTRASVVLPDGHIDIAIDAALKASVIGDPNATYRVRISSECFTVTTTREWTFPLHTAASADSATVGTLIARVSPVTSIEFLYRANDGITTPLTPDWVELDYGYTFLNEQTILDRQGDWFQLPRRPFPAPVWIHLPGRRAHGDADLASEISALSEYGSVTLTKAVRGHRRGASGTRMLPPGNYVVVSHQGRTLEIRKEEAFDSPCADTPPPKPARPQTYLVEAEEFYDADLHLTLRPAYTKGC